MVQTLHLDQGIVLKGFFIVLLCIIWSISFPSPAKAISFPGTNNVNGSQLFQSLQSGQISLSQASGILSQQGKLPLGSSSQFLQGLQRLQSGGKLDLGSAGNIVNSALQGQNINTGNINNVIQTFQGLAGGQANPTAIAGLVNQVAGGAIPTDVGKFLGSLGQGGSFGNAAQTVGQLGNLPIGDAGKLLQSLQSGKIDLGSATKLVSSALGGQFNAGNIGDVVKTVQGLASGQANPAAIAGLVNQVAGGAIPPELGKTLGAIQNLGNIADIKSIGDVFKNPQVTKALGEVLNQAGLPPQAAKAVETISGITSLVSNPQAFLQNPAAVGALAKSVIDALPASIKGPLTAALGGAAGLQNAVSNGIAGALSGQQQQGQQQQGQQQQGQGQCTETRVEAPGPPGNYITEKECTTNVGGISCGAVCPTCSDCAPKINQHHRRIRAHETSEFERHRNWITTTYFLEYILPAMMLMSEQLTTAGMQQVQVIGSFFDAKHQLETQRLFQQLTAKAHKDYHPSESLCAIGTNVRSLAASERRSNLTHTAFANRMMQRQLSHGDSISTIGGESDRRSRLKLFIEKFCNKTDHAEGLQLICKNGGNNKEQINMDVNYTNAVENKLTLEIDFTEEGADDTTADEENVFALSANLFGNEILPILDESLLVSSDDNPSALADYYLDIRAVAAKRSVAQNSFAAITALKAEGNTESAPFLKAILAEAGVEPSEVKDRLGEKPSYFAQMEVMTKDLYQNPSFYANLYDKPVNIERKGAALQAIELMQDRDLYRSLLRSEAILATLLETLTRKEHDRISNELDGITFDGETRQSNAGGGS